MKNKLRIYHNTRSKHPCIIIEPNGKKHVPDRIVDTKPNRNAANWEFLEKYVGQEVVFYTDGIPKTRVLTRTGKNEKGVWFFEVT